MPQTAATDPSKLGAERVPVLPRAEAASQVCNPYDYGNCTASGCWLPPYDIARTVQIGGRPRGLALTSKPAPSGHRFLPLWPLECPPAPATCNRRVVTLVNTLLFTTPPPLCGTPLCRLGPGHLGGLSDGGWLMCIDHKRLPRHRPCVVYTWQRLTQCTCVLRFACILLLACAVHSVHEWNPPIVWCRYSAGINVDPSFDVAAGTQLGCEVHMFDPAPGMQFGTHGSIVEEVLPRLHRNLHFHPVGIGPPSRRSGGGGGAMGAAAGT